MKIKLATRILAGVALVAGLGVFASQVLTSDQVAAAPVAAEPTAVASAPAAATVDGTDLAVDMNTWRETGFIPKPVSVSRPRRGR